MTPTASLKWYCTAGNNDARQERSGASASTLPSAFTPLTRVPLLRSYMASPTSVQRGLMLYSADAVVTRPAPSVARPWKPAVVP